MLVIYIAIRNGKLIFSSLDACPGCDYGDLDMSPAAFNDLAPQSQGVVQIECVLSLPRLCRVRADCFPSHMRKWDYV